MDKLSDKEKQYIDNPVSEFDELNLKDKLLRGIFGYGFSQVLFKERIRPVMMAI